MKKLILKIKETKTLQLVLILQVMAFIALWFSEANGKMSFRYLDLIYLPIVLSLLVKKQWRKHLFDAAVSSGVLNLLLTLIYYYTKESANLGTLLSFGLGVAIPGVISFVKWVIFEFKQPNIKSDLGLSMLSWGLMSLANPPFKFGFISFFVLTPWLIVLSRSTRSRGLLVSYVGGILYHVINFYWLLNVTKIGPPVFVLIGLFLFVSFFSLFYVLMGRVFQKVKDSWLIWIYPILWAGVEVFRTKGDFSFPWNHLGYTLGGFTEFLQALSLIGVFGYSILIVFSNVWIFKMLKTKSYKLASVTLIIPIVLYVYGSVVLSNAPVNADIPAKDKIDVVMFQPNVIQDKKWSKEFYQSTIDNLWSMLHEVEDKYIKNTPKEQQPDLLVLPETAIPEFIRKKQIYIELKRYVQKIKIPIVIGALNYDREGPEGREIRFYNSAYIFERDQRPKEYRKIKLVPFSERIPFDDVFPMLNYVNFGEGDFVPGDTLPVYDSNGFAYTPNICYESIYPSFIRKAVDQGSRVIINITNDGWFGKSAAPYHHSNLVRYRSAENGIPIVRAANSGVSTFFDEYGREYKKTNLMEKTIVRYQLPLKTRDTLYAKIGGSVENLLFWIALIMLIVIKFFETKISKDKL